MNTTVGFSSSEIMDRKALPIQVDCSLEEASPRMADAEVSPLRETDRPRLTGMPPDRDVLR